MNIYFQDTSIEMPNDNAKQAVICKVYEYKKVSTGFKKTKKIFPHKLETKMNVKGAKNFVSKGFLDFVVNKAKRQLEPKPILSKAGEVIGFCRECQLEIWVHCRLIGRIVVREHPNVESDELILGSEFLKRAGKRVRLNFR